MYEDIIESKEKGFEVQMRSVKTGFADEIEQLTSLFAGSSRELVSTTIKLRKMKKEFDEFKKKSEG